MKAHFKRDIFQWDAFLDEPLGRFDAVFGQQLGKGVPARCALFAEQAADVMGRDIERFSQIAQSDRPMIILCDELDALR